MIEVRESNCRYKKSGKNVTNRKKVEYDKIIILVKYGECGTNETIRPGLSLGTSEHYIQLKHPLNCPHRSSSG